jgi:hypothetical protein
MTDAKSKDFNFFRTPKLVPLVGSTVLLLSLYAMAFHGPAIPLAPLRDFAVANRDLCVVIHYAAWAAHVIEAAYVYHVATQLGLSTATKWALQTFLVGVGAARGAGELGWRGGWDCSHTLHTFRYPITHTHTHTPSPIPQFGFGSTALILNYRKKLAKSS